MFNYVISLKSAVDRRQHIEKEFSQQHIPYTFFDAFQLNEENENILQHYVPALSKSSLANKLKSCFMSHVLLWQKCVDENLPFIAIFEDDIFLSSVANKFLSEYDWLKERFAFNQYFILRLETIYMKSEYCKTKIPDYQNRKFNRLMSGHFGMGGYILSQVAAKKLLALFKNTDIFIEEIDQIIFKQLLKDEQYPVYQCEPAIIIQDCILNKDNCTLTSSLAPERERERESKNNKKAKKNLWRSISKEIGRFRRRILKGYRRIKFL
ncbi:glycosyltransferase family 25 protein [Histophilus somni]|uniref:glycosyltransferase family 25 protein n=1 Tax=Histophilus somni TaxID=731 RepID=UPI0011C1D1EA|nr:glycosyltransferase family 25 protein [Histophilus somni]QEH12883.1 glycosyltransferase family 25 protein [Histophilus somni]QEH27368.1 glycosyltransferase family 25 protein [Histophilus somni]QEH51568.1 glycosyltransferase family 25 protein [Histophilus somni]QQF65239.1 glycosyltransferase family 25 protein [Histophilus somni]QQF69972.1 glycosyltransferase family 25 protein [Histophilus somni]